MNPDTKELLDLLDESGTPTGERKPRDAVHRDGDWHRSLHVWIVKERRYVLLQRRAEHKALEPGKVDVSVGGHFQAGEALPQVLREAEEELGLQVSPAQLRYLETRAAERIYPNTVDREFQETYLMHCDQPLEHYTLNPREVYVLYEVPLSDAIALYKYGQYVAAAGFDCYQRRNDALLIADDLISQAREDTVKVLETIQAWLTTEQDREG